MSAALLLTLLLAQVDAGTALAPRELRTRLERPQVRLGEPVRYTIEVHHAQDQRYELTPPKDLGAFEAREVKRSRRDLAGGAAVTTFEVTLAVFELGPQRVPDFPLEVTAPGQSGRVPVSGPTVEVVSSLPANAEAEGADLRDIKPPVEVPIRSWRLVWILLGLLAAAVGAYFLYRWLKRPRVAEVIAEPVRPLDARTRAALDQLRADDLAGQGRAREHYFRASEIVRGYLGERYGFEALECTTPELLEALRKLPTPGLPLEALVAFAHEADLVKYAKSEASPADCKRALDFAYLLLERTWPPPPPVVAPSHAGPAHAP